MFKKETRKLVNFVNIEDIIPRYNTKTKDSLKILDLDRSEIGVCKI